MLFLSLCSLRNFSINLIILASLKREPRVIQSTSDGPSGMIYIKRTNELAIAAEYANNLNIIKLGY